MSRPPVPPPSRRQRRLQAHAAAAPVPGSRRPIRPSQAPRPAWRSPIVLASLGAVAFAAVLVILAGGFNVFGSKDFRTPPTVYSASLTNGFTMGSESAPVTIEVYSDFQCPVCKTFITTELPSLLTQYVMTGVVKIVGIDIDIIDPKKAGESLELAAGGTCAAQQDKYWQYHDFVFWNQGRENKGDHSRAFIDKVATAAGLDMTAFATCFAGADIRPAILAATSDALAHGINGTPTIFVNGTSFTGVPDYASLASFIDKLAAASPSPSAVPSVAPTAP